jgi:hypothetical protein
VAPGGGSSGSQRALLLPAGFALALGALGSSPLAADSATLRASLVGAAVAMLAWTAALRLGAGRARRIEVAVRSQHWLQACAHLSIYVYWGWYWREVYHSAWLILAQLLFAYSFDSLLAWSRRESWQLGFGPFPIIFSTNLFLWFKPEYFYLQFLMVGTGFLVKELVRWQRDGRSTHVFNPSSFPLSLFSLGLIVTGNTGITWGREIATTLFYPPHIFAWIFLVGLPGQLLFGVTTMTMSAVASAWAFSAAYHAIFGTYFFFDSYIPIAVFLGMHLLFTDPSTAPRRELGRILFGVLYGLGVVLLYWLLGALHAPTFYDKLLPVPVLNLSVRAIDRMAGRLASSPSLAWLDPARLGATLAPRSRNLAYMTAWALLFAALSFGGALGDVHPGNRLPFWETACRQGRRHACRNLAQMEERYCFQGVGWACNELGVLVDEKKVVIEANAAQLYARGCELDFKPACENADLAARATDRDSPTQPPRRGSARPADYRLMVDVKNPDERPESAIDSLRLACEQGWSSACTSMAFMYLEGRGVARDPAHAASLYEKACSDGEPISCSDLGLMYKEGNGVPRDGARALGLLGRACDLGMVDACRWLVKERPQAGQPEPAR